MKECSVSLIILGLFLYTFGPVSVKPFLEIIYPTKRKKHDIIRQKTLKQGVFQK